MKLSQLGTTTWAALPTITPASSSISATDSPISTEIVEASRIVPAKTAASARSLIARSFQVGLASRGLMWVCCP